MRHLCTQGCWGQSPCPWSCSGIPASPTLGVSQHPWPLGVSWLMGSFECAQVHWSISTVRAFGASLPSNCLGCPCTHSLWCLCTLNGLREQDHCSLHYLALQSPVPWSFSFPRASRWSLHPKHLGCLTPRLSAECTHGRTFGVSAPRTLGASLHQKPWGYLCTQCLWSTSTCETFGVSLNPGPWSISTPKTFGVSHT